MRHNISSLLIAVSAALYSFVIVPIIFLFLMRNTDDSLIWMLAFGAGPLFLAADFIVATIAGSVAFQLAKARLPDREWDLARGMLLLLPLVLFVAIAGTVGWRYHAMQNPPELGPQQTGLPTLLPC